MCMCVRMRTCYTYTSADGQRSTDHLILLRPLTQLGDRLADTEPLWSSYFCCMHLPSAGVMSTLMTMSSFLNRFTGFELRPSFLPSKHSYLLSYLPSQWGFFFFFFFFQWGFFNGWFMAYKLILFCFLCLYFPFFVLFCISRAKWMRTMGTFGIHLG